MIYTILDASEIVLKELGEPLSPFWLASQLEEMRLWRASDYDVRAALEKDMKEWGEKTQFVKLADDEWGLRSWDES